MITTEQIKQLREVTSGGVMDCKKALEEAKGDMKKATELLKKWGVEKSEKKADRETKAGIIDSYVHNDKVGVLLEITCETDFVARTDDFKKLSHEICLQIASMNPKDEKALLKQEYIRDPKLTIETLVKEAIGKLGENIKVVRFTRYQLGESIDGSNKNSKEKVQPSELSTQKATKSRIVSKEFDTWLNEFTDENKDLIKALARH